jgi:hypothetical protein
MMTRKGRKTEIMVRRDNERRTTTTLNTKKIMDYMLRSHTFSLFSSL